jgi:hypothetical protein
MRPIHFDDIFHKLNAPRDRKMRPIGDISPNLVTLYENEWKRETVYDFLWRHQNHEETLTVRRSPALRKRELSTILRAKIICGKGGWKKSLKSQQTYFHKLCGKCLYLYFFNTQTMHIKPFLQQHCYVSLNTLYTGGIWTRGCDVRCATPPGPSLKLTYLLMHL